MNPICTNSTLNIACFKGNELSENEQLLFIIWYMANELSVNGGPNYTSLLTNGPNSLHNLAVQQFKNYSMSDIMAANVAIAYNNAIRAGAAVSSNPNSVIQNVRRLQSVPQLDLYRMLTLLLCQLGNHADYPQ